jgi:serine/threonine-protein kinase
MRVSAKVIDATTASLMQQFASPRTIVEAIVATSRQLRKQPERLLTAAHPILIRFIRSGLLVPADAVAAARLDARHRTGEQVAGSVIRSCLQVLNDTELYVVESARHGTAVLKLARVAADRTLGDFAREARVLSQLNGASAPVLFESGCIDDRAFLLMEWCRGVSAERAANAIRRGSSADMSELAQLAVSIADAYASLHERKIVHGDVHEGNVLVDRDGKVTLVDFGLAVIGDGDAAHPEKRGGQHFYMEPEFVRASIARTSSPRATTKSDQYAVAAMLYSLITGAHYLDFALDEARALQQILSEPMLPFAQRGVAPWPGVERALARALSKTPEERFASAADFAQAFRAATSTAPSFVVTHGAGVELDRHAPVVQALLQRLEHLALAPTDPPLAAPTASVTFGAAGIAYGLHRLASLRDDPSLLALADSWSWRAMAERRRSRAFYDGSELARGAFGHSAMYYGSSGLDVVQALVSNAIGDLSTMNDAVRRLGALPRGAGETLDFVLGVPGTLLGLSLVAEAAPSDDVVRYAPLLSAGERCARTIATELAAHPPIHDDEDFVNLGIAHGWAGALFALMRWHQASGWPLPDASRDRLHQLSEMGEPTDRGMRWPWRDHRTDGGITHGYMPGWCNGSAGFVFLWLTAHEVFRDTQLLELAEAAAWDVWEDPENTGYDLCCGRAGRAYALLALYRATGDDAWRRRAKSLADDALDLVAELTEPSPALYKGAFGAMLVHAELERPHFARMPLFEGEGWITPTTAIRRDP